MLRALILLIVLIPLAIWLDREQRAGRFQRVDELFLDFLVANARDRLTTPDPAAPADAVVLLRIDPAQKNEYSAWPPQPLDWQIILKALREHEPDVVVIPEPLTWPKPTPDFVPAVAESLVPLSSVVFGVEAQPASAEGMPVFMGGLENALPRFEKAGGEIARVPSIAALIQAPQEELRRHAELGLIVEKSLPYALRAEDRLLPGVIAQVLARQSRTPYATHRVLFGPGAGAHLQNGVFVPLQPDGSIAVDDKKTVITVNALDLLSGGLADALSAKDRQHLQNASIIVIGQDDEKQPGTARRHAQALASLLALPRLRVLDEMEQRIAWGVFGLIGLWLVLTVPRRKSPARGLLLIFLTLVALFLAFQSALIWFPPTIPAALLSASAIIGAFLGRKA